MQTISLGHVSVSKEQLSAIFEKWGIEPVSLFGSALRDDFTTKSDVDILIEYKDNIRHSLFEYESMKNDFQRVFGREIDLVNAAGIRSSRNPVRKENILSSAQFFYGRPSW